MNAIFFAKPQRDTQSADNEMKTIFRKDEKATYRLSTLANSPTHHLTNSPTHQEFIKDRQKGNRKYIFWEICKKLSIKSYLYFIGED